MLFLPFRIVECLASDIVNKHLELYCVTCSLIASMHLLTVALISSFIVMNVVVGIVVNAISEVTAENTKEEAEDKVSETELIGEIHSLKEQLDRLEKQLAKSAK